MADALGRRVVGRREIFRGETLHIGVKFCVKFRDRRELSPTRRRFRVAERFRVEPIRVDEARKKETDKEVEVRLRQPDRAPEFVGIVAGEKGRDLFNLRDERRETLGRVPLELLERRLTAVLQTVAKRRGSVG